MSSDLDPTAAEREPAPPLDDDALPAYLSALGIPGIADVHVHFHPPAVTRAVWDYFDRAEQEYGTAWPVRYRDESDAARADALRAMGVLAFTSLVYAHKPGMAAWLNDWALDFAAGTPGCVPSATFFPEAGVAAYLAAALDRGARVAKVHLQVGDFDPREPVLAPVWGLLAERAVPVVVHCGSGPLAGRFTGPGPIGAVLAEHPRLRVLVAHLGGPEYAEFLDLVAAHPSAALDTTMAATGFMQRWMPYPDSLVPRLRELALAGRVHFGSDFPNIPYPYAHQVEALVRLGLGAEALRAVLWTSPAGLLGVEAPEATPGRTTH